MKGNNFRLAGALYEAGSWYDQAKAIYRAALRISRDEGRNWTQILLSDVTSAAFCVVPHPTNDNIIYVGGEEANASGSSFPVLMKTTNGGTSWTRIATSITSYNGERIQILEIDKSNPNKLFAGMYNRMFVSTDAGSTWVPIATNSSPICIFIDPVNSENVFMGCYDGIFSSSNGGSSWTDISGTIGCRNVRAIEYDSQNRILYVGTMFGGIYRRLLNPTVDVENGALLSEFRLFQNYPNPFNPTTAISYELVAASCVSLRVFDVLGKEIASLENGVRQAGLHTVRWDPTGLPSGAYLYELRSGAVRQTRRMLLVR
jgi:hypothetical protein